MREPKDLHEVRRALIASGRISAHATLTDVPGGVSCIVAIVRDGPDAFFVKVPLNKLAVRDDWTAGMARGNNEARILNYLNGHLGPLRTPLVRFFEEDTFILGEELIEGPPPTYKSELMAGRAHLDVATSLGHATSALHRLPPPPSLDRDETERLFDELRLDAYYRASALRAPQFGDALQNLVDDTVTTSVTTLVHGDLTPKNVLITESGAVLVDWEVVNIGDSSFDLGTMSAHFVLKALRKDAVAPDAMLDAAASFWNAYDGPANRARGLRHTAGVMIARLHGKSPVEYMDDAPSRQRVEAVAADVFNGTVTTMDELVQRVRRDLGAEY